MKKKDKKDNEKDVDKIIDRHTEDVKDVARFLGEPGIEDRMPDDIKRAIMTVTKHFKYAALDLIVNSGKVKLTTDLTIKLAGTPSPNSPRGFTQAYLIFINPEGKLRNPHLGKRGDVYTLYITYPLSYVSTVERMLKEAKCYCWIGDFGTPENRNLHADLHAEY